MTRRTAAALTFSAFLSAAILNRTNFNLPEVHVNALNGGTLIEASPARQMQLGLRYVF